MGESRRRDTGGIMAEKKERETLVMREKIIMKYSGLAKADID